MGEEGGKQKVMMRRKFKKMIIGYKGVTTSLRGSVPKYRITPTT